MARIRVNVMLDENILESVDSEAEVEGMSRSSLVEKVLQEHLEAQKRLREEEERRRKMEEACREMDKLAEKLGDWDPVSIIRKFRDGNWDIRVAEEIEMEREKDKEKDKEKER